MIVFHEGLPGAGKSYEACVYHILPALKEGRRVVTNIEGISHDKFSELSGIPVKFLHQILFCFDHADLEDTKERNMAQKASIIKGASEDSLIVIDEIQDIWPSDRQRMDSSDQKFFTEHRHKGHDIICMGQDRRDCHNVIKRRIQRCIVFTKKTALGMPNSYKWEAFEATTPEKYKKISSGGRSYEKCYFGLYKSHTISTKNKNTYADDRTNIFKQKGFIYGLLIAVVAAFFSVKFLVGFFTNPNQVSGEALKVHVSKPHPPPSHSSLSSPNPSSSSSFVDSSSAEFSSSNKYAQSNTQRVDPPEPPPMDIFHEEIKRYRPRLSGFVSVRGGLQSAYVEIVDNSLHVRDRYTLAAIEALGWSYRYDAAGLHVTKENFAKTVRPWPIDPFGRASDHKINSI